MPIPRPHHSLQRVATLGDRSSQICRGFQRHGEIGAHRSLRRRVDGVTQRLFEVNDPLAGIIGQQTRQVVGVSEQRGIPQGDRTVECLAKQVLRPIVLTSTVFHVRPVGRHRRAEDAQPWR